MKKTNQCSVQDPNRSCKVEALIPVGERGQMVLPKEIRDKAGINIGDKLVLMTCEKNKKIYCLGLIKVEELVEMVKESLDPIMEKLLH
ncbi:MAG: AbrB/MazE/SpoVT family DNA-binding domain-containing protein [Planctomycetes bacterium]|nr:AbrB/MazE/SpoVT family DNA-binding domain-containing protein [Planctomycetota bacterium]